MPSDGEDYSDEHEIMLYKSPVVKRYISNFDGSMYMEIPDILGADQVLNTVANQLDIKVDDYYRWLYNSQDTLVASNRYISIDKQGNRYETQSLENERKALYDDREHMQYKLFINTK